MSQAAEQMKQANLDTNVILFSMWTEAIKNFAEVGKGNIIFLDGSSESMQRNMQQIMAMMQMKGDSESEPELTICWLYNFDYQGIQLANF